MIPPGTSGSYTKYQSMHPSAQTFRMNPTQEPDTYTRYERMTHPDLNNYTRCQMMPPQEPVCDTYTPSSRTHRDISQSQRLMQQNMRNLKTEMLERTARLETEARMTRTRMGVVPSHSRMSWDFGLSDGKDRRQCLLFEKEVLEIQAKEDETSAESEDSYKYVIFAIYILFIGFTAYVLLFNKP